VSKSECRCERDLSAEETMTSKGKIIALYNDMLALTEDEPAITTGEVDIHFWHGERRLLTLHQFIGFGEIVPTMRYLSCEKEIPIEEITLSCEKGGDKG
jgi:hypothetical protein